MSFDYVVVPVSKDPGFLEWIDMWGLSLPSSERESRNPTAQEVLKVLDNLDGISVKHHFDDKTWEAYIVDSEGRKIAYINCKNLQGDEYEPYTLWFDSDSDEIFCLLVVQQLTKICGPLGLFATTGSAVPVIVTPDISPEDAFDTWKETEKRGGE